MDKKNHEIINCYYRETDLYDYQNLQKATLYNSNLFNFPIGNAFYTLSLYQDFSQNTGDIDIYDIEYSIFYLNDLNDKINCIYFTISIHNQSIKNRLIVGTNITCQITGGSGKYLGATGTVNFIVDINSVRNIIIDVYY